MTALSISAASVAWVSGPIQQDAVAGEAFIAGAMVYLKSDGKWWKAQADGAAAEAGAEGLGMALATADAAGARVSVALPDSIVSVGAGTAGIAYFVGSVAGLLNPIADIATSTWKVTMAAIGIGSNKLKLARVYDAGSVVP